VPAAGIRDALVHEAVAGAGHRIEDGLEGLREAGVVGGAELLLHRPGTVGPGRVERSLAEGELAGERVGIGRGAAVGDLDADPVQPGL
jgi:hypothetical protein